MSMACFCNHKKVNRFFFKCSILKIKKQPHKKERYFTCGVLQGYFSISSVQLLSHVQLFATPWIAVCQASLSITNSRSLLKLMSIESVVPSNHLILCHPLLLPPLIFPNIGVFSNFSTSYCILSFLSSNDKILCS